MSTELEFVSKQKSQVEEQLKPKSFTYLPEEGLQGEDIPSHVLWENIKVESVQISFRSPLKFKEIFNAETCEISDNNILVKKAELEGYIGLLFESSKVSALEVVVPVEFLIFQENGDVIKERKMIKLFRPELKVEIPTDTVILNPDTGFVKGRIRIKNIGRGTLLIRISATEDSPIKLETPPDQREFAEKFEEDLVQEMSKLAEDFPQFQAVFDEMLEWENKDFLEISTEERNKLVEYFSKLANVLASNRTLLERFVEGYAKAFAKNTELIEAVRKVITIYETMVSKDILLVNPLDEIVLAEKKERIALKILQTDRVFDKYEEIKLPNIELASSGAVRVPIYRLFDWR
jgi:hypothetical protein